MKFQTKHRQSLIDIFIKSLEEDVIPWEKPWNLNELYNPVSNRKFTGASNKMLLSCISNRNGYTDPRWCTFKQANKMGWQIIKGQKGTPIEFWSFIDHRSNHTISISEAREILSSVKNAKDFIKTVSKTYVVFNAQQIKGIPLLEPLIRNQSDEDMVNKIESLVNGLGVRMKQGNIASYNPVTDTITIPSRDQFKDPDYYCATLLHEVCHSTGHKSRLDRDLTGNDNLTVYAKEELKAELASAFLMNDFQINYDDQHLNNHKAYIQSWIKELKNSPEELFASLKSANKICDYILELYPNKAIDDELLQQQNISLDDRLNKAKDRQNESTEKDNPIIKTNKEALAI